MLENVLEVRPQEQYSISYSISNDLKDEFDLYVEQCVGADGIAVLDDVTETETENGIHGTVVLSFDNEHPFDVDYLWSVAQTLNDLTSGKSLIEDYNDYVKQN